MRQRSLEGINSNAGNRATCNIVSKRNDLSFDNYEMKYILCFFFFSGHNAADSPRVLDVKRPLVTLMKYRI